MFSEHDISGEGFLTQITLMEFVSYMNALLRNKLRFPDACFLTSNAGLGFLYFVSPLMLKDLELGNDVFYTFRKFNSRIQLFTITM